LLRLEQLSFPHRVLFSPVWNQSVSTFCHL
jgi:hypothetical protein